MDNKESDGNLAGHVFARLFRVERKQDRSGLT